MFVVLFWFHFSNPMDTSSAYHCLKNLNSQLKSTGPVLVANNGKDKHASVCLILRLVSKKGNFKIGTNDTIDQVLQCKSFISILLLIISYFLAIEGGDYSLQLLFIKRAANKRDRWSNHVSPMQLYQLFLLIPVSFISIGCISWRKKRSRRNFLCNCN